MNNKKVIDDALSFFLNNGYYLIIQTDNMLTFQSDARDYSLLILIFLFFCGIIPAIVYFMLSSKLQVTISLSGEADAVKVTVFGNSIVAKEDAEEFKKTLN